MRSKLKIHMNNTVTKRLFDCVVAVLVLTVAILIFSCGNETPLTGEKPFPAQTDAPAVGIETPDFVTVVDKQKAMSRPFLAPPGVCGSIGRDGGVVCNGPITLIIPEGALADYTDICISAVNQQQLIAEFTPAGQWFAGDVSMRWNLINTSAEGQAEDVTTIWFNPATQLWEAVTTEEPIDTNTTETLIRHFSKYAQQVGG